MITCGAQASLIDQMELHSEDMQVQHRRSLQLLTEIGGQMERGQSGCAGLRRVLDSFVAFAQIHFSDEEEFMQYNGLPSNLLIEHQTAHGEFLEHMRLFLYGSDAELLAGAPALLRWMCGWLEEHASGEDQVYLDYFRRCRAERV
jgi:hemerythrin-like metal-binding protein